jgi:thiamine-monophosphate kinase
MTKTSVIGSEEALIQGFLAPLAAGAPGAFGLNDDCAVLAPVEGQEFVLKTDAVAAGVHFLPHDPPAGIAWKALAVNVSDLVAKGATPVGYLMSLAFPEAPSRHWMQEFADGLAAAQRHFDMTLLGGDTDRRDGPLSITIAAIGRIPRGRMVRRATARPGDVLLVSGTLGDAALGLFVHQGRKMARLVWKLDKAGLDFLEQRYLRPEPRLALVTHLLEHASAAMDISDGLVKDLGRMCRASGVGARVREIDVPCSPPARKVIDQLEGWRQVALTGGDDYEVLAAVPPGEAEKFVGAAARAGIILTPIGEVVAGSGVAVLAADGSPLVIDDQGYDHFSEGPGHRRRRRRGR